MGLWARFKRVFFASTGAALDRIENPELVLQQTIRDMRDRVPELNNAVAQVMATERLLLKQKENLSRFSFFVSVNRLIAEAAFPEKQSGLANFLHQTFPKVE